MLTESLKQQLTDIYQGCSLIASEDTAYKGEYSSQHGRLHNHCGCVSHIVQKELGGKFLTGTVNGVYHIWNLLPCGTAVDLTTEQFDGEENENFTPLVRGKTKSSFTITTRIKMFEMLYYSEI